MKFLNLPIPSLNFPPDRYISYEESVKNISLILLNSHFSQGGVRPYVPAMIEVGGLQIKPTPDKLPDVRHFTFILSSIQSTLDMLL